LKNASPAQPAGPSAGFQWLSGHYFCIIQDDFKHGIPISFSQKMRKQLTFFTIIFDVRRWPMQTHSASNAHFGHGGDDALGLLG
jgi:hypothetical protein